jgi:hypothetical protein
MATATKSGKRRQVARTIRVVLPPSAESPFTVVNITVNGKGTYYAVTGIPADQGTGFRVAKMDTATTEEEVYYVNLSPDARTCDCKGHVRWGHCKHADGLAALLQSGQLSEGGAR